MSFWICLTVVYFLLAAVSTKLKEKDNLLLEICAIFLVWFVTSFRNHLGWDFDSYVYMYYISSNSLVFDYAEPSLKYIIILLRDFGFTYQMLFVVYSSLTYLFFVMGINNYLKYSYQRINAIALYFVCESLFFWTCGTIRQMLAVSIVFFAYQYILNKNKKNFVLFVMLATFFHYSAILFLGLYFMPMKKYELKIYVLIFVFAIVLHSAEIFKILFDNLSGFAFSDVNMKYVNYLSNSNDLSLYYSSTILINVIIFFACYKELKKDENPDASAFLNISSLFIGYSILTVDISTLYRLRSYFSIFFIIMIVQEFSKHRKWGMSLVVIIYGIELLWNIYQTGQSPVGAMHPSISANNIEFMCNFDLIE